ncbi:MAG: protein BatD [Chloroflexi bacterium]|nr:protein BatD [Chloroflexota bacterium]
MKMTIRVTVLLISLLGLALFSPSSILADMRLETIGNIAVYRVAPSQATIGQKVWVTFILENGANVAKNITIVEKIGNADFDTSEAKYIETPYGMKSWYYEWKIKLPPKTNTTIGYWLIPKQIGSYVISPARIDIDGKTSYLQAGSIEIKCLTDGRCDAQSGENYLNCPEECTTGLADGICDSAADGRCDPDCEKAFDPDCKAGKIPIRLSRSLIVYLIGGAVLFTIVIVVVVALLVRRKP